MSATNSLEIINLEFVLKKKIEIEIEISRNIQGIE